jgi:hypothetical protein
MHNRFEKSRIAQLTSRYSPDELPRLPMDFGDLLSLLWRLDHHAAAPGKTQYYKRCVLALAQGLGLKDRSIFRLIQIAQPGEIYAQIPNAPYRGTSRLIDAADRHSAIRVLMELRADILKIGAYHTLWKSQGRWPGMGIQDDELRERVFAVLFTALQGQFGDFGRLLLVVDIVLSDLLIGPAPIPDVSIDQLINNYGYPNPHDRANWDLFSDDLSESKS